MTSRQGFPLSTWGYVVSWPVSGIVCPEQDPVLHELAQALALVSSETHERTQEWAAIDIRLCALMHLLGYTWDEVQRAQLKNTGALSTSLSDGP